MPSSLPLHSPDPWPGGFSTPTDAHANQRILVRGDGVHLVDKTGRRLIDGLAGRWSALVGHGRREIADAMHRQALALARHPRHPDQTTEPVLQLAERLTRLAPPRLSHIFFTNSGSEANECALKIVRAWQRARGQPQRQKIISQAHSCHGRTVCATSLGGIAERQSPFDLPLPGFIAVPSPYGFAARTALSHVEYGRWCLRETERVIEQEGPTTIAALVVEPVQAVGGVIVPPPGYLTELRAIARRHDILFVVDESITAFGRLGAWFASGLWELDPDLITVGHGLSGGYSPIGATLCSEHIHETLTRNPEIGPVLLPDGHPVAAAAALAMLDVIERDELITTVVQQTAPHFQDRLYALANSRQVGEVRGIGLLGAIELVPEHGPSPYLANPRLGEQAANEIRAEGALVFGRNNFVALAPALTITHEQIDALFEAVARGLARLRA